MLWWVSMTKNELGTNGFILLLSPYHSLFNIIGRQGRNLEAGASSGAMERCLMVCSSCLLSLLSCIHQDHQPGSRLIGIKENNPWAQMLECLVPTEWNCWGRTRRCRLVEKSVWLKAEFEVSKSQARPSLFLFFLLLLFLLLLLPLSLSLFPFPSFPFSLQINYCFSTMPVCFLPWWSYINTLKL